MKLQLQTPTTTQEKARVAVLGASGYTGAEVVRLSALHPHITITALTGEKQAGKVGLWVPNERNERRAMPSLIS